MKLGEAKYCPLCGCESLERDAYRLTHTNRRGKKGLTETQFQHQQALEFICKACGAAFKIGPSMRHDHATSLIASERRQRPPHEHNLRYEIREVFPALGSEHVPAR